MKLLFYVIYVIILLVICILMYQYSYNMVLGYEVERCNIIFSDGITKKLPFDEYYSGTCEQLQEQVGHMTWIEYLSGLVERYKELGKTFQEMSK